MWKVFCFLKWFLSLLIYLFNNCSILTLFNQIWVSVCVDIFYLLILYAMSDFSLSLITHLQLLLLVLLFALLLLAVLVWFEELDAALPEGPGYAAELEFICNACILSFVFLAARVVGDISRSATFWTTLQTGHDPFWQVSQRSMHSLWNMWRQRRVRMRTPSSKSCWHTVHLK